MREKLRFLGLDVHAETIAVAIAESDGEERSLGTIPRHSSRRAGGQTAGSGPFGGDAEAMPKMGRLLQIKPVVQLSALANYHQLRKGTANFPFADYASSDNS
jgi:hypothetical protein